FTVVSMTVSLVAVFIPILFLGGIIGRLFSEFAVTLGVAVLLSAVVSLTLTPMLASRYLHDQPHHGRVYELFERLFERSRAAYTVGLRWSVEHYRTTLVLATALFAASVWLFYVVPKGFIPSEDTGFIIGNTRAPEGVTFPELLAMQSKVAAIVQANPNVKGVMSSAGQGFGGTRGSNIGRLVLHLKPASERRDNADQVIAELRRAVSQVYGMQVFFQNPPAIRIGAFSSNSNYQYVLQGSDVEQLFRAGADLEQKLRGQPGLRDVNLDAELNNPQINVSIRRDRASALGVSANAIEQTLYDAYGGRQISTIYGASDSYQVILQLAPRYQQDMNALNALYVRSDDGHLVPLAAVADITSGVGPLSINHYEQLPSVTLSFDLAPGASLGQVTSEIEQVAASSLPAGVTGTFAGTAQTFQASMRDLPLLLGFTIVLIYMVLGILYEHFVHPLTILTALPLAGFGAALALLLFHQELNVFSFAGLILLVGLVKKNGIIMVDFALQIRRKQGLAPAEAIIEACRVRYRPIMMTTFAAILGTLPIALGVGAGAHSRQALGIATVGGLVFSQALTLFVTPAFYVAMERLSERLRRRAGVGVTV
ncbi:MAG: efflux RND transporter permease subunit, partial [Gammaproteobacteria bacterium]